MLDLAAQVPGVRIDRDAYLRAALKRHCTDEQIERAVVDGPAAAGVSIEIITELANGSIAFEASKVTGISAIAGLPGGVAIIGTISADMVQYMGHMLRISQKLAYIYSWPDLFAAEGEEVDESTEGILTLFVGVVLGFGSPRAG